MSDAIRAPSPRSILAAAWPLFQVSWPGCLPLALLGVAASGAPQAAAIEAGEARGFVHGSDWWGVTAVTTLLVLICQGGMLLRQAAIASGQKLAPFEAMRRAAMRLPQSLGTALLLFAPGLLAMAFVGRDGRIVAVLGLVAAAWLLWMAFAWPASLLDPCDPLTALRRAARLVRGRLGAVLLLEVIAFACVLVFVLLAGILLGVVMGIAGMGAATGSGQLGLSRLLLAALCAFPVVWLGAVWVTAFRQLRAGMTEGS
jgi:hypothetical protein